MELHSKLSRQMAIDKRPEIQEHMLIVMNNSTHEEHLSQPLQTINKQFKSAVTFLTGYNGIFNVTNKCNKFYFTVSINDDDFSVFSVPPGGYAIVSLNNEIKRIITDEGNFTESNYPFTIKPIFPTQSSFISFSSNITGS